MTLSIGSSLTGGIRRIANRNGLLLALAYVAVGALWQVAFYSAFVAWLQREGVQTEDVALPSVAAPLPVLAGATVVSLLGLQYLTIVAARTFVGGHSRSIPAEYLTRNVGFVLVNSLVGGLAFGVVVFVGSLLLFVPGVVAYVAFVFVHLFVAVEDENFVAAFRESWALTDGHWLRLFVLLTMLVVGVGTVSGFLSVIVLVAGSSAGSQALGTVASGVVALPFSLLTLGVLAEAFDQLRSARGAGGEALSDI